MQRGTLRAISSSGVWGLKMTGGKRAAAEILPEGLRHQAKEQGLDLEGRGQAAGGYEVGERQDWSCALAGVPGSSGVVKAEFDGKRMKGWGAPVREGKRVICKNTVLLVPFPLSVSLPEAQLCQLGTHCTLNTLPASPPCVTKAPLTHTWGAALTWKLLILSQQE